MSFDKGSSHVTTTKKIQDIFSTPNIALWPFKVNLLSKPLTPGNH